MKVLAAALCVRHSTMRFALAKQYKRSQRSAFFTLSFSVFVADDRRAGAAGSQRQASGPGAHGGRSRSSEQNDGRSILVELLCTIKGTVIKALKVLLKITLFTSCFIDAIR